MSQSRYVVCLPDLDDVAHFFENDSTKSIGEFVEKGEHILELEFAKCTVGIEAPEAGVVTGMFVEESKQVNTGEPICEVMVVESEGQVLAAAKRILELRFPLEFEKLVEVLGRVEYGAISESFGLLGTGSIDQIILALSSK